MNDFCKKPDRDVPGIVCGYPFPCPWHSALIDLDPDAEGAEMTVVVGPKVPAAAVAKVLEVARALK